MDKSISRTSKLRELVAEYGGPAKFAKNRTRDEADKPIDATYISQILNGHRSFGEKAAINMARRAGLPDNYFDIEDDSAPDDPSKVLPTPPEKLPARVQHIVDSVIALRNNPQILTTIENILALANHPDIPSPEDSHFRPGRLVRMPKGITVPNVTISRRVTDSEK